MAKVNEVALVTVYVWIGTTLYEFYVDSYEEAMKAAAKTANAYGPTFIETTTGAQLYDNGYSLERDDGIVVV